MAKQLNAMNKCCCCCCWERMMFRAFSILRYMWQRRMESNKNEKWDLWDGMFIAKGDICFHWASSSFHLYLPTNSKRSAMAKYNVQTFPVQLCRYALPIKWKNQHMKKKQRSPTDFWSHKKHILTIMIFRLFVQIFCVCVLIPLFCSVLCVFFLLQSEQHFSYT